MREGVQDFANEMENKALTLKKIIIMLYIFPSRDERKRSVTARSWGSCESYHHE